MRLFTIKVSDWCNPSAKHPSSHSALFFLATRGTHGHGWLAQSHPFHTAQKPPTPTNICLSSAVGTDTISIHFWVQWLCSSHRFVSAPASIGSDGNMTYDIFSIMLLFWCKMASERKKPIDNNLNHIATFLFFWYQIRCSIVRVCWLTTQHGQKYVDTYKVGCAPPKPQTWICFKTVSNLLVHNSVTRSSVSMFTGTVESS